MPHRHHRLTDAGDPADSVENLRLDTLEDGLFHAGTYIFVVAGLDILWWSGKLLVGTMLMGFGLFNLLEAVIDHHLLGLHHVNETVPRAQWI